MPPPVALSLCILFIIYLLKIEHDRKANVSFSLWIPTIWFMIIGSRMVYLWFTPTQSDLALTDAMLEGNPVDRNIFLILMLVGLLILMTRKVEWIDILKRNSWVLLFFLFCGISIAWSDFPLASIKRYIKAIGCLIMIMIILTEKDPFEAFKSMIRRAAYVLIPLSIVLIKYYPALGRHYHRWSGELMITGVTMHKNILGMLCAICAIVLVADLLLTWRNKIGKGKDIFLQCLVLIMTFWLLINSESKTSQVCFTIGVMAYLWMGLPGIRDKLKKFGYYFFLLLFTGLASQYLFDWMPYFVSLLGRDDTLTGRTDIWKVAISMVNNPIIGTGFETFWLGDRLDNFIKVFGPFGNEAHNGYLEIYLDLGIIGVVLLILLLFHSYKNGLAESGRHYEYGRLLLTLWLMMISLNMTESGFRPMQMTGFIFFFTTLHRSQPANGVIQAIDIRNHLE